MKKMFVTQQKSLCLLLLILGSLTLAHSQPVISSFPASGTVGTNITINGSNFNTTLSNNLVYIGNMKATITGGAPPNSLIVTVPNGAAYGPITVLNRVTRLSAVSTKYFTPVATSTKSTITQPDFLLDDNVVQPAQITYGVLGDLDGDNKPDLVTHFEFGVPSYDNILVVRRNNSTAGGALAMNASQTTYEIPGGYDRQGTPALGDIDGDGILDIVAVGRKDGTTDAVVLVLRNGGTGVTYTPSSPFVVGGGASKAATADLDGDGKLDVVTCNFAGASFSILHNISTGGTINFSPKIDFTTIGFGQALDMIVVDVDNDGKPDVITIANASNTSLGVFRNTSTPGNISFDAGVGFPISPVPKRIAAGDIDGDGYMDFVITNGSTNNFQVFRNRYTVANTIDFSNPVSYPVGALQRACALGDLNGDGKLDVIVASDQNFGGNDYRAFIYRNTSTSGTISFKEADKVTLTGPNALITFLAIADLNDDGRQDIALATSNTARLYLYRNAPTTVPNITSISSSSDGGGPYALISGNNFNATPGNNSVFFGSIKATPYTGSASSLQVRIPAGASYAPLTVLNNANGLSAKSTTFFSPIQTLNKATLSPTDLVQQANISVTSAALFFMTAADLDADGKPELIEVDRTYNRLYIRHNTSTGNTISFGTTYTINLDAYPTPGRIAVGDLNGDGRMDIAVPIAGSHRIVVLANNGSLSGFTVGAQIATGTGPIAVAIGDVDGDGKPDIAVANALQQNIQVFRNLNAYTGAFNFSLAEAALFDNISADIHMLLMTDLDGDNRPDLIGQSSQNSGTNTLAVFQNTSSVASISFTPKTVVAAPANSGLLAMTLAQLNMNDYPEVITGHTNNNNYSYYNNASTSGNITISSRTEKPLGSPQSWIAPGDLNGDGKADLVASLINPDASSTYQIAISRNNTLASTISMDDVFTLPVNGSPLALVVEDFNGDGQPDIITSSSANLTIYRNALLFAPTAQASNILVTAAGTSANISWTNGNGQSRAVFMKADNAGTPAPVNGTDYTANTVFGSGSQIGSSGWYCVYNGNSNGVSVTGLTASTEYRVMVVEYNNNGYANAAAYNTSTNVNNPVNFMSRATLNSLQRVTAALTNASSVAFQVTFASAVSALSTSHFTLSTTGSVAGASITSLTGTSTSYTVTVNTGTGDGTIRLNLDNATDLIPQLTNTLPFTGETYTIDKTLPTLAPVSIVSSNTLTSVAKVGDIITLNFTASEAITPTVTIASHSMSATNTGGFNWTASYTMSGSDAEGNIPFSIDMIDVAGNTGTTVTATSNSSAVNFDKTAPTLSPVTISSNNTNTALAKSGDIITLNFTANEGITPTVTIAAHTVSATNTAGSNWTASYTMTNTDAEGSIPFSIDMIDVAGNTGTTVTTTSNSSAVNFDKTVPTVSPVTIGSNNTNTALAKAGDIITLNFTASESITPTVTIATHTVSATNTAGFNWTASYTITNTDAEGNVPFSLAIVDAAGNAGTTATTTTNSSAVTFDKTAPTLSSVSISSSNASNTLAKTGDLITLNFTASESITPTVAITTHTVSATNTGGLNWTASYTMTNTDAEGTVPFVITMVDPSGNAGTQVTTTTNSSAVNFDRSNPTLPTVTLVSNNSNTTKAKTGDVITLSFTANETITPTVTIATHAVTTTNTGGLNWTATYTMTNTDLEGNVPFSIDVVDQAGNAGATVTATTNSNAVNFDRTMPSLLSVTLASNNSDPAAARVGDVVTLQFSASESIVPIVSIAGHTVPATNTSGNNWTASYTMTNSDAVGSIPFSIGYADLAGNTATPVTTTTNNSSIQFTINYEVVFTNGTTGTLAVCTDANATSLDQLLQVLDSDNGQNLIWTVITAPAHGSLSGLPFNVNSNGSQVTPAGTGYRPAAGYSGNDAFTIRVSDGISTHDITIQVTVNALPTGSIQTPQGSILCGPTATVPLTATGGSSYEWFRDNNPITGNTATIQADAVGVYRVNIVSAEGCKAPASGTITITRLTAPVLQFSNTDNCVNLPILFTNQSLVNNSGPVSYLWTDNNGHSSTATSATFTYTQAGNYDVQLTVTPQACPALATTLTRTITIAASVPGVRLPSVNAQKNTLTPLQARTQSGATYNWIPNRFLTSPNIPNPQIFATEGQEYLIKATLPGGCTTTDTLLVRILEDATGIYVANVFTPNGDGQNDRLIINLGVSIRSFRYFRVFNRWGKQVFETSQPNIGWDGRVNGVLQPMDTYTWVIEAIDDTGKIIKRQGSVTLLR